MNFNEYKVLAMRTNIDDRSDTKNLLNACLGLVEEWGEMERAIDRQSKKDELSDIYWYIALIHSINDRISIPLETDLTFRETLSLFCGIIKKHAFQGHELNKNLVAIFADKFLYLIEEECKNQGIHPSKAMEHNIDKLKKRYPNGFEKERSINREI